MIKDSIRIIKDYFKLVKGDKKWILSLSTCSILYHLVSLFIPVFTSNIIYEVTRKNASATYLNIIWLITTYVVYNIFHYLYYISYSNNFKHSYKNLRERVVDKVLTYDVEFSDKISKGTILNTINTDTQHLAEMMDNICEITVGFFKIIVMIGIFLKTNFVIGLVVLIMEGLYIESFNYLNVMNTKYLRRQQKYRDKLTDNLSQILNGLGEIKVFNIDDKIKSNFSIIANKWSNQYAKKRVYCDIRYGLLPGMIHFGKIILYLVLTYFVLTGKYEVNVLILLITYFENIMSSTTELMGFSREIRDWSVSITRINRILNYSSNQITFEENNNDEIEGLLEFKKVNFSYKTKNKGSIKNISFIAEPNKITALVGHSGSGKTTITDLILRKHKVDSGEILVDCESIYDYSKEVYSKNIVGVNQSPFIFNMSIRKNLSLVDSNFDNQVEACKRVGIHDYIMSLPKGYNTILTEDATNFSGGQKQLLAVARTLLSKAEILIFDEVTSSLDTLLVEKIKDIFENLKLDHTVIVITHKKDVMKIADKIIILSEGEIVGEGTHDNLLKGNPIYIDLQTNSISHSHKEQENIIISDDSE